MARQLNDLERASFKEFNETLLRSFKCGLTGDEIAIVERDGQEIAISKKDLK